MDEQPGAPHVVQRGGAAPSRRLPLSSRSRTGAGRRLSKLQAFADGAYFCRPSASSTSVESTAREFPCLRVHSR